MNNIEPVPLTLFRVQHGSSFTYHDENEGFVAKGHYWMDYSHWVNPTKVRKHLDWWDKSSEPSPFISLFSNLPDARERASFHQGKGHRDIVIAQVNLTETVPYRLRIQFPEGPIELPEQEFSYKTISVWVVNPRSSGDWAFGTLSTVVKLQTLMTVLAIDRGRIKLQRPSQMTHWRELTVLLS
ncbi:hypothetical protein BM1_00711 [Bipolaris maydis]|nr:hypothetical protein BM1_00711 [Bipolaris maydis]